MHPEPRAAPSTGLPAADAIKQEDVPSESDLPSRGSRTGGPQPVSGAGLALLRVAGGAVAELLSGFLTSHPASPSLLPELLGRTVPPPAQADETALAQAPGPQPPARSYSGEGQSQDLGWKGPPGGNGRLGGLPQPAQRDCACAADALGNISWSQSRLSLPCSGAFQRAGSGRRLWSPACLVR